MSGALREILGSMREDDGHGVVRMETWCSTTTDDLWEALTTPGRLGRWLGDVAGDLALGGAFRATFTSSWSGSGRVEVCDPQRRLVVRLTEDDEGGETLVEATLTPEGDGVRLVVEESGLPLTELSAYGAGWQVHVEDLGHHLAGEERTDWRGRWLELAPDYRARPVG
jgi:uncharacterized protein YndB with AHSA1/START domain